MHARRSLAGALDVFQERNEGREQISEPEQVGGARVSILSDKMTSVPRSVGWVSLVTFLGWVLGSETLASLLGGDERGFLWVTLHFIVNPFLGVLVTALVFLSAFAPGHAWVRVVTAGFSVVPLTVACLSFSGNTVWAQVLSCGLHAGTP